MDYTPLGASGLKVSPLWLGTMMFGDQTDEHEAARIVASAREAGVNAIDTANAYADGESERITGRLIKPDREHWMLASKLSRIQWERRPERSRPVAPPHRAGGRCQPDAARHRLDRRALPPSRRPDDAARGDARGDRSPDRARQDPPLRRLELPRLAGRAHRREVPLDGHRAADRLPAALQRDVARRSKPNCCRAAPTTASASSSTARSRAAC